MPSSRGGTGGGTPRSGNPRSTPQTNTQNRYRDPVEDYEPPAGRNYFKRREEPRTNARPPSVMEDDDLLRKLEDEIRAAQEERARYLQSKYALDRERREFEEHKYNVEQELEDERAELDLLKRKEKKEAQKGMKSVEERYRSVSALLATEREVNRKLLEENDTLRQQLDDLTSTMREKQKVSNSEVARLRRDVESLSKRNAELLAMTKESQLEVLAPPAREKSASQSDRRSESRTSNAITNDPNNSYQPPAATTNVTNPNTRATKGSTLQPTLDVEDVQEPEGGYASSHVVLDFTPRAKDEGMAEKRSREMEERMKREEAERQNRKLQREKAAEEKRVRELEEAARREEEKTKKLEEDRLKRREEEQQQKASKADATAADVSNERKRSGHPPTTPRGTKSTVTKSKPVKESTKKKLPTKEELIGDEEEIPAEDFPNDALVSQTNIGDNASKREVLYRSGKREIHYANGTVKVVLPSGHTILHFANGDIKRMFPSGKSTYWYDAAQTLHTQRPDGTQTFEFQSTGQVERHHPDGSKEILYPDGIFKTVKADGSEETFFSEK
ncbi:centromere protein J [Angomonas deanei]|nr:centromere protein J [Angomonas deanei]|eukprot:EPY29463.1 centromere protein J [Angomonas deanei]